MADGSNFDIPFCDFGIPDPHCGADQDIPNYWAMMAKNHQWAHVNKQIASPWLLYDTLQTYRLRREPGMRTQTNGMEFYFDLSCRSENVEALLAQAVGEELPLEESCDECKKKNGKFTSCVVVPGLITEMTECANCHWHDEESTGRNRCTFYHAPKRISGRALSLVAGVSMGPNEELTGLDTVLRKEIELRNEAQTSGDLDSFDRHYNEIQKILQRKKELLAQR